MPNSHIVSSFDADIKNLREKVVEMAKLVQEQFNNAEKALVNKDIDLANTVRVRDETVDQLEQEIEKKAIELIAMRSPMADDLREIISAIKICNALERIGDYAKNLSKRVIVLNEQNQFEMNTTVISQMISIIDIMNTDIIDAYVNRNSDKAISVWTRDLAVDNLFDSFFRELLTHMMENPKSITSATHFLFIAKNIERAGDHITNIAEMIFYIIEGRQLEMVRPKGGLGREEDL